MSKSGRPAASRGLWDLLVALPLVCSCGTGAVTEDPFQAHRNLDYVETTDYPDQKDRLDVFAPPNASDLPVLIFLHGGGLVDGDKEFSNYERPDQALVPDFVPRRFTREGLVVVLPNYRLSPSVKHPEHARDAAQIVRWVHSNIREYGGDPERIFLSGHSAGAYLAALLGVDSSYLDRVELSPDILAGVIPVSAFIYVPEVAPSPDRPKTVWGEEEEVWEQASVGSFIGPHKPPFLLLFADGDDDWRREQNRRFQKQMIESDNQVSLLEIPGRSHLSIWSRILEPGDGTSQAIVNFIQETH